MLIAPASGWVAVSPAAAAPPPAFHFVWTAGTSNTAFDFTIMNYPGLNNDPEAVVFVTPNFDPDGSCTNSCQNVTSPVTVQYSDGSWAIINEDTSVAMPVGASFNVLVFPRPTKNAFTVVANNVNAASMTVATTNKPVLVTQTLVPNDVYNDSLVGVIEGADDTASVSNINGSDIPNGAAFNILIGTTNSGGGTDQVVHTKNNIDFGTGVPEAGVAYQDPNAFIVETPLLPARSFLDSFDPNPTGVLWTTEDTTQYWFIFNENESYMTSDMAFNTIVFPS
jgi:hypothetical protein